MTKIAHLADIHIRGLRYLDEMEFTFDQLYQSLDKEKPDLIVVGGDVYHSKLTVTSEYFSCCSKFLRNLSNRAPVILILGNHDLALQNLNRKDALSPVIEALGDTKYPIIFEQDFRYKNLFFHNFSILKKKEEWPNEDTILDGLHDGVYEEDDIHIALYHGSINESTFDNGWISRGNQDDIDIFRGFDFAMLGDIHRHQMLTPRIGYPGSLRQNNYGEDRDKGYLLWEIKTKDGYTVKRVILPQKRYFYTINLDNPENIPNDLDILPDCRIRVKLSKRVNISDDLKIREAIKRIYKPCSDVVTIPPKDAIKIDDIQVGEDHVSQEDLRNKDIQKRLILDFFKDEGLEQELLDAVCALDEKYNSYLDHNVARNVIWRIKKATWENIFSYGKGNQIDFSKVNGLVGVFGKNMVGKSSVFDGLCYCAWDKINKEGANKNVDFINTRKKKCKYGLDIDFGGADYFIRRSTARAKTAKSNPVNDIDFYTKKSGKKTSLNGETKPNTNVNIRNTFGQLEDFVATSLSPQEGLLDFLNTRGTDKKKLFAKFLDVNIFEQKYKEADKDFQDLKSSVKKYDGVDFHHLIEDCANETKNLEKELSNELEFKEKVEKDLEKINNRIASLSSKMKDIDEEIDLDEIEKAIVGNQLQIDEIEAEIAEINEMEPEFLRLWDEVQSWSEEEAELVDAKLEVIKEVEKELKKMQEESALLDQVPCGDKFPMCAFITKAHRAKAELRNFDVSRLEVKDKLLAEQKYYKETYEKFEEVEQGQFKKNNLNLQLENLKLKQDSLLKRKQSVEKAQDAIESNRQLIDQIKNLKKEKEELLLKSGRHNQAILTFSKNLGLQEGKMLKLQEDEKHAEELREKFLAFSLYLKAMGKNGISYRIISSRLPLVNEEANRILSQVCDLSLVIEDNAEEKSIRLFIAGGEKGKRIVELGSGFEKTMVALALRAALWNISSLPKTPMLILDEPFMFVEEGKFGATVRMLKYLKNYFEHIFIISHNESLKNVVDTTIYVVQDDDGYATCKV